MKKIILLPLAAILAISCSNNRTMTVEGSFKGIPDQLIYIGSGFNGFDKVDSTLLTGGKFSFTLPVPEKADLYYVTLTDFSIAQGFITEPGTIVIEIDADRESVGTVSGTESNELFTKRWATEQAFDNRKNDLIARSRELSDADSLEYRSLQEQFNAINEEQNSDLRAFISRNRNSVVSALFLSRVDTWTMDYRQMDSLVNLLGDGVPDNVFSDALHQRRNALEKVAVGKQAPDFTLNTPDGNPFTLSSLRGKTVLVDFWASWCGPCRHENPNLVRIYDKYKEYGFDIVGVSLDERESAWTGAIEKDKLNWHQVSELKGWGGSVHKEYAVIGIPHTVLVGPDGTIVATQLFGEELEAVIADSIGYEE